jgi:hypothetical protein
METVASTTREPWNKGKLVGQKTPFKLKEIWAIRVRLQIASRCRDLALFSLAIDSKLRWLAQSHLAAIHLSESVFTLSDFHRVAADADVSDLVAKFFGARINMTGTLHLYALLNVQGLNGPLQSITY